MVLWAFGHADRECVRYRKVETDRPGTLDTWRVYPITAAIYIVHRFRMERVLIHLLDGVDSSRENCEVCSAWFLSR
jgi:hypothetical protein